MELFMIKMGIDQSYTSTGIVIIDNDSIIYHDQIHTDKSQDNYDRVQLISDKLCKIFNEYKPDQINIEGLSFGIRGNATRDLAGLQYVIICNLRKCGGVINITAPKALKKFATNNGKATKQDMYNNLPTNALNYLNGTGVKKSKGLYDLVDAYWLAMYGVQ